ncbi:MAG: Crp/Fnr family transcriptional regulator [Bacteroidia bacterium]|nr:Crp/Fnr family transcriptional regulator [Bacteroidia bacterium]
MDIFDSFLQQFPNYSPEAFEAVRPYLKVRDLIAGEYFLQQGEVSKQIAFIEEGLLRLYYLKDGKEITHCFCKEKTLSTSYSSLITQTESKISIQAIEASRLIVLSYEALQKLYRSHLFWQEVGRLAGENEYVINEHHKHFLMDLSATERYLQILEKDKALLQRIPLRYLASYLQIAPETLSRIRKKISRI